MPLNIEPEIIEQTDFGGGFMPDLEDAAVPKNGLLDVNNLLPDRETGILETRKGFTRFSNLAAAITAAGDDPANFEVKSLNSYNIAHGSTNELGSQYLIAVIRKTPKPSPREIDDIQVWAINVQTETATRLDDNNVRIWNHYAAAHWGLTIDNAYYGGSELDPIYSWRPVFANGTTNPNPFDPDASMGQYATNQWSAASVAYSVGDRVWAEVTYTNEAGKEVTKKHVFVCTEAHTSANAFKPLEGKGSSKKWQNLGRYIPLWVSGTAYKIGDEVSYLVTGSANYPRGLPASGPNRYSTFVAIRDHTAGTGNDAAPPGPNWEPRRGPTSNVAEYHGGRLFMRDSDAGTSRVRYTGRILSDGFFDITNWLSDDVSGAGFFDVPTGSGDDVRGIKGNGNILIIVKRRSTHKLSGLSPSTWKLEPVDTAKGGLYKGAITSHDGIVYFFGDQGFQMTDGVVVREVPNGNVIRDWIRDNLDLEQNQIYQIEMENFRDFLWLSMPTGEDVVRPNLTLVYDPITGSFWKTDMKTNMFTIQRQDRLDEMFFAKVGAPALIMKYGGTDVDDVGTVATGTQPIPWSMRSCWFTFSTAKEQRRVRRFWATFRAASKSITMKLFRNYKDDVPAWSVTQVSPADPVNYLEGKVVSDYDPHAISIELSGTAAPAAILSTAIQTQYRRKRKGRVGINA